MGCVEGSVGVRGGMRGFWGGRGDGGESCFGEGGGGEGNV